MKSYKHKIMKKGTIILVGLLLLPQIVAAQNPNQEKLESYRIAFFTQRLKLTPSEAEKFWPLYNGLQEGRVKIQAERVKLNQRLNQGAEGLSERELTAMGDKLIELEVMETELAVKFHAEIKGVLPPVKVLRFYHAENQYKIMLLNQLQERRQDRINPGQR